MVTSALSTGVRFTVTAVFIAALPLPSTDAADRVQGGTPSGRRRDHRAALPLSSGLLAFYHGASRSTGHPRVGSKTRPSAAGVCGDEAQATRVGQQSTRNPYESVSSHRGRRSVQRSLVGAS